jgi:hypothetical protein
MNTIAEWIEEGLKQGLTPNDLYSLYEEFKKKWEEIENSKKKPFSKIFEELQLQLPIGSCWNITKKSSRYVNEYGSFFFNDSDSTQLKIRIKSVLLKETEDDDTIKITYDFFQIYRNSEEGEVADLRYEEGWICVYEEKDLEPIGFESITEQEYNEFGNKIKSIIEFV